MSYSEKNIKLVNLAQINPAAFLYRGVGCIVLTKDNKILLQQRGRDWQRFPNCLATFGGQIESDETPIQALIRELHEELGAQVKALDIVALGAITEAVTQHRELIYIYFWHDKFNTITGCYEGEARYYDDIPAVLSHPQIMDDVLWALNECRVRGLLEK